MLKIYITSQIEKSRKKMAEWNQDILYIDLVVGKVNLVMLRIYVEGRIKCL